MSIQPTKPISYNGVFDRSIYDQSEYLHGRAENNITDQGLKDHLLLKKKERLNTVLLNTAKQRLETYQKITEKAIPFTDDRDFNGIFNNWFRPILSTVINFNGLDQVIIPVDREEARRKVFELAFEIQLMMLGLDKEQISDLEHQYILKKRNIPSQELKDEIEQTLLMTRDQGVPIHLVREFIENALRLTNMIVRAPNIDIITNEKIKNFNPDLQYRLKCITQKFITDAQHVDSKDTCNRSIYYFYGNPSTGKSTAAKLIPELLDLPFHVYTIRSSDDLSRENLEGKPRSYYESNNPGLLGYALLSQNSKKASYLNTVLVLEDIDRILFSANVNESLAFLLDYLDPEKKDFKSPYFHAKLNIAWLSIIMTANQKIPDKPKKPQEKDPYAALRSRVTQVYFPDFTKDKIQSISLPYAGIIGNKYGIAKEAINANKTKWINQAIQKQQEQAVSVELRDVKRQIESEVIEEFLVQKDAHQDKKPRKE